MQISAIQSEDYMRDSSSGKHFSCRRETAAALGISFVFHMTAAVMLFLIASNVAPPAVRENPRIIHITWVEASRLAEKESPAAPAVRQAANPGKEQTLSGRPVILPEEKRKQLIADDSSKTAAPASSGHNSHAVNSSHDSGRVVALTHGLKTHGADNSAAHASMAKPRYRDNSPPSYPLTARMRGYEGVVLVSAEILAEGRVGSLKIKSSSGYEMLDKSALDAVKFWKFDPAKRMGKPVIAWVDIPVRYVLKKSR